MSDKNDPPDNKRRKLASASSSCFIGLQDWLGNTTQPPEALQSLLGKGVKIRQDLYQLQKLLDQAGFRTSIVHSPRSAVSLYKDSCTLLEGENLDKAAAIARDYLLTMLGLHPQQEERETWYASQMRESHCGHQFVARLQVACRKAMKEVSVQTWLQQHATAKLSQVDIKHLMKLLLQVDPKLRQEQLDHEWDRIYWYHCTLSNALMQQFIAKYHGCIVKDVFFKTSHVAKYERLTFYLYDPEIDLVKPSHNFIFLPDLVHALQPKSIIDDNNSTTQNNMELECGTKSIVQDMMATFWSHLLRHGGYYASQTMKQALSPALERYFLSGLRQDPKVPLKLNAHFEPCEPISLYLWGKAGAGKSSFVRHVPAAIQAAVETHADPEMLVRFVKQALNKPYKDLCMELELRPNNNDLSVMSIIQSRKCTMTQSKPGLVVVGLEEMPQYFSETNKEHHDPHQLQVCQLVSQRFGGRKGEFNGTKAAPRNSEKRGIGNDASLITLFTSNYTMEEPSQEALKRLPMFEYLTVVEMKAIGGTDRRDFAHAFMQQSIHDRVHSTFPSVSISLESLDIPLGEGDTRPLVRHLRMLAYYAAMRIATNGFSQNTMVSVSIKQKEKLCKVLVHDRPPLDLHVGSLDNLFPVQHQTMDSRSSQIIEAYKAKSSLSSQSYNELSTILDFWLGGVLAPAVIISKDRNLLENLMNVIESSTKDLQKTNGEVQCISNIEAGTYKMMKSLYDPRGTPNLRDDILKLGGGQRTVGGVGSSTLVAVSLKCADADAQLCIREMVEDSPSMTAFSSDNSALYKSGLLFLVHVQNGDITPELQSRASLIW